MRLIIPNRFVDLEKKYPTDPLFFIAGPIRGGGNHQDAIYRQLDAKVPDCIIVTPCRIQPDDPLYEYCLPADEEDRFERQLDFERHYLERAAASGYEGRRGGAILFNLACESKTAPRDDGDPYARDTYGEVGEWRGALKYHKGLRVIIAAEEGFPGLSQIKRNFWHVMGPNYPIYRTVDELTDAAARTVHS